MNTTDQDNVSVVYHAIELRALNVVRLLREDPRVDWNLRSVNGGSPITRALTVCNVDILKIVLSVPEVDLDVLDFDNEDYGRLGLNLPQLIVYCERDNGKSCLACLELLMKEVEVRRQKAGAREPLVDWNRRFDNPAEDTPILYAIKNKKYKLVKLLLQTRGVDETIRDKSGLCVRDIARSVIGTYQWQGGKSKLFSPGGEGSLLSWLCCPSPGGSSRGSAGAALLWGRARPDLTAGSC